MKSFKIKGLNCYITIDDDFMEEFNIDSEYTGHIADYEEAARYFLQESDLLGWKEHFEVEEVMPIDYEIGVIFSL